MEVQVKIRQLLQKWKSLFITTSLSRSASTADTSLSISLPLVMTLRVSDIWCALLIALTLLCESADNHSSPEIIVTAAQQLERSQVPDEMSGIQLVQVGTDP
jgi:hypothetical protein